MMPAFVLCTTCTFLSCEDPDSEKKTGTDDKNMSNLEKILISYAWESDVNYDHLIYGSGADINFSWDSEKNTFFFLGKNEGFVKTFRHTEDTYFGTKNKTYTDILVYYIEDDKVVVNGTPYVLQGDYLVQQNSSSPSTYKKRALTSDDRSYLEIAPFDVLEGNTRANFPVDIKCVATGRGYAQSGNYTFYPIDIRISVSKEDHIYSRHIGSIEATFSIKSGTGKMYNNEIKHISTVQITEDKDITFELPREIYIAGDNPVIQVSCRAWDYQKGKYYTMGYGTDDYNITKPDYIKELEGNAGNSGDDNTGSNDDSSETSGTIGNYDYVDLALPSGTLWAVHNIGAYAAEDYGEYFAWGEVESKNEFSWETYKYCKARSYTTGVVYELTKYMTSSSYFYTSPDGLTELEKSDDAAYKKWGRNWTIPSKEQYNELCNSNYVTKKIETINGKKGLKITSKKNGKSIFFPCAGRMDETSNTTKDKYGEYWSRSLNTRDELWSNCKDAWLFNFASNSSDAALATSYRYYGSAIRPVVNR